MKKHVYFREDLQGLRFLPIEEENCYYLGEFSKSQKKAIERYLNTSSPLSFYELSKFISNHKDEFELE